MLKFKNLTQGGAVLKSIKSNNEAVIASLYKKRKVRSDIKLVKKVMCYAQQLMRHDGMLDWGGKDGALALAWKEIRENGNKYRYLKARRTNKDEEYSRIVMIGKWSDYVAPKGGGRKLKEGQVLFADAARLNCGCKNVTISTYARS